MWDCSQEITVGELRALKARYDAQLQAYPSANGTALSLSQLITLFKRPASPFLQKVFREYILPRASPAGLAFARAKEKLLTRRCDVPAVPPNATAYTRKADLTELLVAIALTADGTYEDRTQLVFDLFDLDRDGTLKRDELRSLLSTVARAATKLQLALASTDGIAIEFAVASALAYAGRADNVVPPEDIAARSLEENESSDGSDAGSSPPWSGGKGESDQQMTIGIDHGMRGGGHTKDVAPQTRITREEFVLWTAKDAVPCQFRTLCGVASRTRALVQLWERRANSLFLRNALYSARPRWSVASAGAKGSRNAWIAQQCASSLATIAFTAAPFITAISKRAIADGSSNDEAGIFLCLYYNR